MNVRGPLMRGRSIAESLMTDHCVIARNAADPVLNETTGKYEAATAQVYAGKCRVQARNLLSTEREAGDQFTITNRVVLSLPVATSGLATGDYVTVTLCPYFPQMVGARYRVRSVLDKSHPTALRLECEEA